MQVTNSKSNSPYSLATLPVILGKTSNSDFNVTLFLSVKSRCHSSLPVQCLVARVALTLRFDHQIFNFNRWPISGIDNLSDHSAELSPTYYKGLSQYKSFVMHVLTRYTFSEMLPLVRHKDNYLWYWLVF